MIVGGGRCWPRRRVPNRWPLLALRSPRKQVSGACLRRWGELDGERNPAGDRSSHPRRNGDLDLAGAPGRSARHLRRLSPRLRYPLCSRCPPDANTVRVRVDQVASVRRRPQASVTVHQRSSGPKNVTQVTCEEGDKAHLQCRPPSRPGSRRLATRIVIPRPHPGSRGTSEAPIEPESQASAESAATDASAAARPSTGGFQDACRPGARADGAHPDCAAESRSGAREAGRPGCWPRHRVARDRRPAGCDQAGGPSALPTPPSWQRDCSGATQLTIGKSSQCQRSSGADNICCRAPTGQQRCPIRRLASGNGREHGVDNGCCPMPRSK